MAAAAAAGLYRVSSAAPASREELLANGFQDGDNVITIATLGEAPSINPFLTNDSEGDWRCKMMFEQFVRIDPASYAPTPGPGIAENWTLDGLTYTFTINANAKFSDGTDLTADDVAFTILGSVLEGIPAIVLFGPLLFPIAKAVGVHEVHYAMIIILAMGMGLFAPPFGVGYYAACAIGRVDPAEGIRPILGYMLALLVGLIVVAAFPWISIGFLK